MPKNSKFNHSLENLLRKAHRLHQQGKLSKAGSEFSKILKIQADNFDALQALGAIKLQEKSYLQAIRFLEMAKAVNPQVPGLLCNLGLAYRYSGDNDKAIAFFEEATRVDSTFGAAHYNLAITHLAAGDTAHALAAFFDAERSRPGHLDTLIQLADILNSLGRFGESIKYYKSALQIEPNNTDFLLQLGKVLQSNRDYEQAVKTYEKIVAIDLDHTEARAKLADAYESTNRFDAAREQAQIILNDYPHQPLASLVIARIERREGKLVEAKDRLLAVDPDESDIGAAIKTELGFLHDRLNEFDDAYRAFAAANNIMAALPAAMAIDTRQSYQLIKSYRAWLNQADDTVHETHAAPKDTAKSPSLIFIVGFPRSGTTLTEQILINNNNVTSIDEVPIIHQLASSLPAILGRELSYPDDLETLSQTELNTVRDLYWSLMAQQASGFGSAEYIIDKMPLNIIHIGLIERLFPEARLIVALRDPRDVCLSCFMQLFQLNESMVQFLSIERTVEYYAAVMDLWLSYREKTKLKWIESRYEDLIADSEQHINRLYEFLRLNKADDAGDFHQQATKRIISTPSYQDVAAPIYQRAKGRWENYRNHIATPLEGVMPFVKAFGYPLN